VLKHQTQGITDQDAVILSTVDASIAKARELRAWWEQKSPTGSFEDRFEIARTYNRPDLGVGFFDTVNMSSGPLRVMGVDQKMHFTWPVPDIPKLQESLREYILHYFLRSTSYAAPSAYYEAGMRSDTPPFLRPFSWCPDDSYKYEGFGYSQIYFGSPGGKRGRFSADDQYRIVDLRTLGPEYDWIVVNVKILDFNLSVQPLGPQAPKLDVPLKESTLVILTPDFIINREHPSPGVLGEYGLGYALLAPSDPGKALVASGPGQFEAGFQTIHFQLLEDGTTCARLTFIFNRPDKILNFNFDPVRWGFQVADLMSFGFASRLFAPLQSALEALPLQLRGFDPITTFIRVADVLTNGYSSQLCISLEHLEKYMLLVHYMQHYSMIVSALLTFGQTKDWTDQKAVPAWAAAGIAA
jgi:hypothetical protein